MHHRVSKRERRKGKRGKEISLPVPSHLLPLLSQSLPPELRGLLPKAPTQLLRTELLPHTLRPGGVEVKVSQEPGQVEGPAEAEPRSKTEVRREF